MRSLYATAATAALTSLPQAFAAPRVEPVPEYAPVLAVLLSEDLFSADYHAPELLDAIHAAHAETWIVSAEPKKPADFAKLLLDAGVKPAALKAAVALTIPHGNLWIRDYGPIMVTETGEAGEASGRAPDAGHLGFIDLKYDDAASVNDDFPVKLGKALGVPTSYVPVLVDGGNLLTAGDFCFTSAANVASRGELEAGPVALATRYRAALGCKTVLVVDNPPHEHVDMWAKVVARDTVLVNELSQDALKLVEAQYGHIPAEIAEIAARLDAGARQLEAAGMKVDRLPMPLPYRGEFRTFANAVLVNGTAIVPAFKRYGWGYDDYPDRQLEASYEERAAKVYARHGFHARFINADGLLYNGGGFHCVLLQIPALAGLNKTGKKDLGRAR